MSITAFCVLFTEQSVSFRLQTEQPRKRETAKKAEILSFLTEVMRDEEEADLETRMKAAELLGKRESLFEKKTPTEKESRVIIVDDLP